jgi:hypothetical protein
MLSVANALLYMASVTRSDEDRQKDDIQIRGEPGNHMALFNFCLYSFNISVLRNKALALIIKPTAYDRSDWGGWPFPQVYK